MRMRMKSLAVAVAVAVLTVLLFVGGPEADDSRLIQAIWNLGHVPLFAGMALIGCTMAFARHHSPFRLFIGCSVLTLILGVAIEGIQGLVGRSFDWMDVAHNFMGTYLGLCLHLLRVRTWPGPRRLSLIGVASLLMLVALQPMAFVVLDIYAMRKAFPVLANFDGELALSRWEHELAELSVSKAPLRPGRQALRVAYQPGIFPDVSLRELPGNWADYKYLHFSVFNTLTTPLAITLKICDREHFVRGYALHDRFNRQLMLQPGWNDLEIVLDEVKNAPAARAMDMENISQLSFFLHESVRPVAIYIEGIRLANH